MGSTVKSFSSYSEADKVTQPSPLQSEMDEGKTLGLGLVTGLVTGLATGFESAAEFGSAAGFESAAGFGSGVEVGLVSTTPRVIVYVEEEERESTYSPLSSLSPTHHNVHSSVTSLNKNPTIINGAHGLGQTGGSAHLHQRQYSCQHVIFTCQQQSYASIQVVLF